MQKVCTRLTRRRRFRRPWIVRHLRDNERIYFLLLDLVGWDTDMEMVGEVQVSKIKLELRNNYIILYNIIAQFLSVRLNDHFPE